MNVSMASEVLEIRLLNLEYHLTSHSVQSLMN